MWFTSSIRIVNSSSKFGTTTIRLQETWLERLNADWLISWWLQTKESIVNWRSRPNQVLLGATWPFSLTMLRGHQTLSSFRSKENWILRKCCALVVIIHIWWLREPVRTIKKTLSEFCKLNTSLRTPSHGGTLTKWLWPISATIISICLWDSQFSVTLIREIIQSMAPSSAPWNKLRCWVTLLCQSPTGVVNKRAGSNSIRCRWTCDRLWTSIWNKVGN